MRVWTHGRTYQKYVRVALVVFMAAASSLQPFSVYALEKDFYSSNDILFYDPNATVCAQGGTISLVGNDNIQKGFNYFVGKGLTQAQSAGIVGNLIVESAGGLDPAIKQGGGGPGRGIAQWEVGGRWDTLLAWAAKQTPPREPIDLLTQLDYLMYEFETTEKTAYADVKAAATVEDAAAKFMIKFERPKDQSQEAQNGRANLARQVLEKYGNGIAAATPASSGPGGCGGSSAAPGQPGETATQGKGWTLKDNTAYTQTSCAAGSTPTNMYQHPTKGFRIQLCKISGTGIEVASVISQQVSDMVAAASQGGVSLNGGGFRSYESQVATRKANNCPDLYTAPSSSCSPPTAPPGSSEHERGLAIDFSSGGGTLRKGTPGYNWLVANAARYGFFNLPSESWHWSVSGY